MERELLEAFREFETRLQQMYRKSNNANDSTVEHRMRGARAFSLFLIGKPLKHGEEAPSAWK